MQPRVVKPPGQDFAVERLKSRYGLGGGCPAEVRPRGLLALPGARPGLRPHRAEGKLAGGVAPDRRGAGAAGRWRARAGRTGFFREVPSP